MIRLVHQPGEVTHQDLGFAVQLDQPARIEARGQVVEVAPLTATALTVQLRATLILTGGTDGESYLVSVPVPMPDGSLREVEVEVACLDGRWAMPDGGAAMLSIAEFVDVFGLDEAVRMTDADGSGRIDRRQLTSALVAAQGAAEAAIGGRYRLPLVTVPVALKTAIADLARARLYVNGAPAGVSEAAKAAQRFLDRIAGGQASLPGASVDDAAPSEDGVLVTPGTLAYPDRLQSYLT